MSKSSSPQPVSDELLSAYVDGEVSPQEAQQVERWLAYSPQGREKVAELRRLSGLLQELPRAELPEEFATEVLQQAERQMLLTAFRNAAPQPLWKRVRYWAFTIGAPAAAACLLVVVLLNRPGPIAPQVGDGTPLKRGPVESEAPEIASTFDAAPATSETTSVGGVAEPKALAGARSGGPQSLPAPPTAPAELATEREAETPMTADARAQAKASPPGSPGDSIETVVDQLKELNAAGRLPVVRIYVVDRRDGMEVLQVMLDAHQITREQRAPSSEGDEGPSPVDQRALFVVASASEMTSALESLRTTTNGVESWTIAEPVELARFDPASQQRMQEALAAVVRSEPPSWIAMGVDAVKPDRTRERAIAENTRPSRPSERRSKPGRAERNPDVARVERHHDGDRPAGGLADVPFTPVPAKRPHNGRQVLVTLNTEPPAASAAVPGATPAEATPAAIPPSKGANDADREESRSAGRAMPLRVLFVIEQRPLPPGAAPPAAPPAAKAAPGDGAA
jgi:hypothetical protein